MKIGKRLKRKITNSKRKIWKVPLPVQIKDDLKNLRKIPTKKIMSSSAVELMIKKQKHLRKFEN